MSDTFTMEDAENDGRIKREVGSELAKVLKREGGQLWQMFLNVCENQGREPKIVLGEGVVKALNDEAFSEQIADVEIDMTQLRSGELRKEDARFVKELREEFREDEGSDMSFIDELVEERLKAKTESPIPSVNRGGAADEQTQKEIQDLKRKVDQIASEVSGQPEQVDTADQKRDLDDIFSGSGEKDEPEQQAQQREQQQSHDEQQEAVEVTEEASSEASSEVDEQEESGRTRIEPEEHGEEEQEDMDEVFDQSVEISDHGEGGDEEEQQEPAEPDQGGKGMTASGVEVPTSEDAEEEVNEDE